VIRLALSAIGRDQPGIVAALSADLLAHELNIEDSQMSILGGHFTIALILAGSDELDRDTLRADLEGTAARIGLDALSLDEIAEAHAGAEPSYIVTVYGADHPGIVHAVADALARRDINITDMQTRLVAEEGSELYAVVLEVALPPGVSREDLDALFERVRAQEGVQASVRELERDVL
jgi:glycine cleavage system transcriptional repressor